MSMSTIVKHVFILRRAIRIRHSGEHFEKPLGVFSERNSKSCEANIEEILILSRKA